MPFGSCFCEDEATDWIRIRHARIALQPAGGFGPSWPRLTSTNPSTNQGETPHEVDFPQSWLGHTRFDMLVAGGIGPRRRSNRTGSERTCFRPSHRLKVVA